MEEKDNPWGYYIALAFQSKELKGAVFNDDYTGWYDVETETFGSNLSDACNKMDREEFLEFLKNYQADMADWFHTIYTNDVASAVKLLLALDIVNVAVERITSLVPQPVSREFSLQWIRDNSKREYDEFVEEFGEHEVPD